MTEQNDGRTEAGRPMRAALMRLRLAELSANEHLPFYTVEELAEAIQGVVDLIRKQEEAK